MGIMTSSLWTLISSCTLHCPVTQVNTQRQHLTQPPFANTILSLECDWLPYGADPVLHHKILRCLEPSWVLPPIWALWIRMPCLLSCFNGWVVPCAETSFAFLFCCLRNWQQKGMTVHSFFAAQCAVSRSRWRHRSSNHLHIIYAASVTTLAFLNIQSLLPSLILSLTDPSLQPPSSSSFTW